MHGKLTNFPLDSFEKIPQAYYLDGIRTHNLCNSWADILPLDHRDCLELHLGPSAALVIYFSCTSAVFKIVHNTDQDQNVIVFLWYCGKIIRQEKWIFGKIGSSN